MRLLGSFRHDKYSESMKIKGLVHCKNKILSSLSHSHFVPTFFLLQKVFWRMLVTKEFRFSLTYIFLTILWKSIGTETFWLPKYLLLYSREESKLYRFGTVWEGVNNDRRFIFGWTIPSSLHGCIFLSQRISWYREVFLSYGKTWMFCLWLDWMHTGQ